MNFIRHNNGIVISKKTPIYLEMDFELYEGKNKMTFGIWPTILQKRKRERENKRNKNLIIFNQDGVCAGSLY